MKKLAVFVLTVVLLFAAGCGRETVPPVSTEPDEWGITLTAKDVTPTGLTVVCTQSGGQPLTELTTGEMFRLEQWKRGEWKPLPALVEQVAWNMLAYGVEYEGSVEWDVAWKGLYDELSPGTYRVVKHIEGYRGMGEFTTKAYYAQFTIAD